MEKLRDTLLQFYSSGVNTNRVRVNGLFADSSAASVLGLAYWIACRSSVLIHQV